MALDARPRARPSRPLGRQRPDAHRQADRQVHRAGRPRLDAEHELARSCSLKITGGVYSASREMKLTFAVESRPGSCRRRRRRSARARRSRAPARARRSGGAGSAAAAARAPAGRRSRPRRRGRRRPARLAFAGAETRRFASRVSACASGGLGRAQRRFGGADLAGAAGELRRDAIARCASSRRGLVAVEAPPWR